MVDFRARMAAERASGKSLDLSTQSKSSLAALVAAKVGARAALRPDTDKPHAAPYHMDPPRPVDESGREKPKITLEGRQLLALEAAMSGRNVFITGPGGVGKTAVVNAIVEELNRSGRPVAVTASTGIAAVAIGGMTIHSTIKLGIARNKDEALRKMGPESVQKAQAHLYDCKVLLIDEISMLTGDYLDMLDWWLGLVMENKPGQHLPFGGLQVILVGDFLQLPPVIKDSDKVAKAYAFESDVWKAAHFEEVYLNQSHRQADPEMFRHLCKIRRGIVDQDTIEFFSPCLGRKLDKPTKLYATNSAAYDENDIQLSKLPGPSTLFKATYSGHEAWQNALRDNCIADDELYLKVGAPVIFIKNNADQGYMNGQRGTVVAFEDGWPIVSRMHESGILEKYALEPSPWEMRDGHDKLLAQMRQVPVKLAYAITIHKSQGMSLETVHVDLAGCFERGQAYVALSRACTVTGLSLNVLPSPANVRASGKVVRYYQELAQKMREKEANRG